MAMRHVISLSINMGSYTSVLGIQMPLRTMPLPPPPREGSIPSPALPDRTGCGAGRGSSQAQGQTLLWEGLQNKVGCLSFGIF